MGDELRQTFFHLLQIGLWGKSRSKQIKQLTPEEWLEIYEVANYHTVEGIIYDSFQFLKGDLLPPQSLLLKWTVRIDKIERHNQKMKSVLMDQYTLFTGKGLQPILQKGQGVAATYNTPLHRISGDIDWYFEDNGYANARALLKENKTKFIDTAGFSLSYKWEGIEVEHHKNLFDIRSPLKYSYLKKIEVLYQQNYRSLEINNLSINILAPELQMLQVNSHILKHQISFGMGIRQFCDSARLYAYYNGQIDTEALKTIYKRTGILKWVHLLHKFLVVYIGLPKEYLPFQYPDNINMNWMAEEIWHGGNFGYYDERYAQGKINSNVSVHPDGAKRIWQNFKRYLPYAPQEAIFFPIMHVYSKFLGIDKD